jgi:hypothetical protein
MATKQPLITADPAKGIKVDAGVVAKSFRDEIKAKVAALKADGIGKSKRHASQRVNLTT